MKTRNKINFLEGLIKNEIESLKKNKKELNRLKKRKFKDLSKYRNFISCNFTIRYRSERFAVGMKINYYRDCRIVVHMKNIEKRYYKELIWTTEEKRKNIIYQFEQIEIAEERQRRFSKNGETRS